MLLSLRRSSLSVPSGVFRWEPDATPFEYGLMTLNSDRENHEKLLQFIRASLQTFIDIERENADYRRTIRVLQNRESANREQRRLVTWVAHSDAGFVEGMQQIAPRVQLDLQMIVYTGGEVLDNLSQREPDLILLGDTFPDIPAEFVMDSVRSQARRCAVLSVAGWSSGGQRLGVLSGPYEEATIERPLDTARDLVALLEEARLRFENLEMSSDFARSFRERHNDWLRGFKNATETLETMIERRS